MNNLWIPIVMQLGALLVGIIEVLIPSMGILTIVALSLLGYSWYYIVQELPSIAAWIFLIADIIIIPITIRLSFSFLRISSLTHSKQLQKGSGLNNMNEPKTDLSGKTGIVDYQLTPTGKALIDNQLYEVCSDGEAIDKGRKIRVVEVIGNKIIVEPID
ncbi:MAG: hypothetical protein HQK83_15380 [Fibrobacteria bacterium]|nr:hypothetical protein [Fibrobacteria bacterium]